MSIFQSIVKIQKSPSGNTQVDSAPTATELTYWSIPITKNMTWGNTIHFLVIWFNFNLS